MNPIWSFARNMFVVMVASLLVLALFGILLAAGYAILPANAQQAEIAITITAAILAFLGGGWLAGRMSPDHPIRMGLIFGLIFGGCSLGYIVPQPWMWPLATGTAIALSLLGAYLANIAWSS
jgi:hypothetical protein